MSPAGDLFEALATERVGERGETAAFRVCESQPAPTELGFEDAIFFLKVRDDLLLVPLQPTGHHGNEYVQDHGVPSGGRQRQHGVVQYTPDLRNFNRVEAAEIFNHTGSFRWAVCAPLPPIRAQSPRSCRPL